MFGAYLLSSCPAFGTMCKVALGSNSFSLLEAFRLAVSFLPHKIVTGQRILFNCEVKSNDRIEWANFMVLLFDSPILSKALFGIQRKIRFWKSISKLGTLYCAPIKISEATFSSCRIAKSIARSAPNERPQIRSGSFTSEYRCSKSPKICEYDISRYLVCG